MARLIIRSMSYSRYLRIATPVASGMPANAGGSRTRKSVGATASTADDKAGCGSDKKTQPERQETPADPYNNGWLPLDPERVDESRLLDLARRESGVDGTGDGE